MKQALTVTLALGLCAGLSACDKSDGGGNSGSAAANAGAAEQAIKAEEQAMLSDWQAKKADGVAGHYTSDATTYLSGQTPAVGQDKIRSTSEGMLKDPAFSLTFANQGVVVAASGDMGYTKGTYHVTYSDPKTKKAVSEDGNYLTVFRKQADGSWKAVEDAAVSGPARPAV
jgi:uncharacterized protein (TIGR02246 family)